MQINSLFLCKAGHGQRCKYLVQAGYGQDHKIQFRIGKPGGQPVLAKRQKRIDILILNKPAEVRVHHARVRKTTHLDMGGIEGQRNKVQQITYILDGGQTGFRPVETLCSEKFQVLIYFSNLLGPAFMVCGQVGQ